jgi:hypothetical protein
VPELRLRSLLHAESIAPKQQSCPGETTRHHPSVDYKGHIINGCKHKHVLLSTWRGIPIRVVDRGTMLHDLDHNSRCASGPRGSGFQNARIHYLETAFHGIEDARRDDEDQGASRPTHSPTRRLTAQAKSEVGTLPP